MNSAPGRAIRRNNAPIRRRKPATSVPDLLFALAMMGWVMAAIFVIASFVNSDVTAGEAGKILARMFAAALAACSLFGFLLGMVLLRDERGRPDHYVTPFILGAIMGGIEAALFLWPADTMLFAPFVLLIFVFRPVRRLVSRALRGDRGYQG